MNAAEGFCGVMLCFCIGAENVNLLVLHRGNTYWDTAHLDSCLYLVYIDTRAPESCTCSLLLAFELLKSSSENCRKEIGVSDFAVYDRFQLSTWNFFALLLQKGLPMGLAP